MSKKMIRLWSRVLVFALICQMMPLSVFANENTEAKEVEEILLETEEEVILEEITDKRTEFSKQFRTNKGNYMAVLYAESVHYEENGEWKEIDNSLVLQKDGTYSNTAGVWNVRLPQQLDEEKEITITKDGYTLSFGLAGELIAEKSDVEIPVTKPEMEMESMKAEQEKSEDSLTEESVEIIEESSILVLEQEESVTVEIEQEESLTSILSQEKSDGEIMIEESSVENLEEDGENKEELQENTESEAGNIEESLEVSEASFEIKPMLTSTASIQKIDVAEAKEAAQFEEFVNEKITSQLLYENTHVKYDLQSNRVKESVIIESYNEQLQGYRYTLNVGSMSPVLREDGRIDFYDENQRELIMMMEAPFLMDENQEFNFNVEVSLEKEGDSYILEYELPTEWLAEEERAWPVILDPIISASADVQNIQDATVASKIVFEYTRPINEVGYYDVDGKERFFIMYESLPVLKSSDVIIAANIQMYKPNNSGKSAVVQVHKVNATWNSQTITWANQPGRNNTIEDYLHVLEAGYYSFDITDIVREWYKGTNTGMMFKAEDSVENGGEDNYKEFYSSDYGSDLYMPQLVIAYRNNNGLESYWDYTTSAAGRAGTGYVNNYTGNMVWVRSDIGFGGNRIPVSVQHIYNLNDSSSNLFGMGNGWRTNFSQ